jgi:hypothetical protein
LTFVADEDVGSFDVSMEYTTAMKVIETFK